MTALTKLVIWRLLALIVLFLVASYAANQALAIALLTPLHDHVPQPDSLAIKAWSYLVVSVVLFACGVWLLVRTITHVNRTKS